MIGITTTHIAAFIDDTSNRRACQGPLECHLTSSTWADAQKALRVAVKSHPERSEHDAIPPGARRRDRGGNARQQRQPPHREQAHLMPRKAYRREKVIDSKGRGAPEKEAERQQKWTEEQKTAGRTRSMTSSTRLPSSQENEQSWAYESKLDRSGQGVRLEAELENAAYARS